MADYFSENNVSGMEQITPKEEPTVSFEYNQVNEFMKSVIDEAVLKLNTKFDVLHRKVLKAHRIHAKSFGGIRKPGGYGYKNYSQLISNKIKNQKRKCQGSPLFSRSESYSPTLPVTVIRNDFQPSYEARSTSKEPSEIELQSCETSVRDCKSPPASVSPMHSVERSPTRSAYTEWKPTYYRNPSAWAVEDVLRFLKQVDPQLLCSVKEIIKHHDIDGRALLLLKNDTIIKHMGVNLGTAVKLSYHINRLREDNYLNH